MEHDMNTQSALIETVPSANLNAIQFGCLSELSAEGILPEMPIMFCDTSDEIPDIDEVLKHAVVNGDQVQVIVKHPHCLCIDDFLVDDICENNHCDDWIPEELMAAIRL
jgi:hypothetical protein